MFTHIVAHHTVTPVGSGRLVAAEKKYHLIIDKIDGKYQFIQSVPDHQIPQATGCFNSRGYAIAVTGNFEVSMPSDALVFQFVQAALIKSRALAGAQLLTNHRDVGHSLAACRYGTACPGRYFIAQFPFIRAELQRRGGLQ